MSLDNVFWIGASPEYGNFIKLSLFKKGKPIKVEGKDYFSKVDYIFRYRILSVLTNWRDIIPALISGLILSLIW
jgi:hypothetical protein